MLNTIMDKSHVPVVYLMSDSCTLTDHPSGTLARPEEFPEIVQQLLPSVQRAKCPPLWCIFNSLSFPKCEAQSPLSIALPFVGRGIPVEIPYKSSEKQEILVGYVGSSSIIDVQLLLCILLRHA